MLVVGVVTYTAVNSTYKGSMLVAAELLALAGLGAGLVRKSGLRGPGPTRAIGWTPWSMLTAGSRTALNPSRYG
ncbi:hypothetical protein [Nonomuraea sp. NPDC049646]|uniref:hypothetical protein n=1 Tax=unclassified Nonomuraea TaxID=2593643 RepID=UPI0037A3261D